MILIEPCCAERQMRQLRNAIKSGGTREFQGYGDLSLTELLPAILTRYSETEMLLVAPTIPDQAADIIGRWLKKQWARMDGNGKIDVIHHLTIVADLRRKKSPMASQWLKENPFGDRLTLIDRQQDDTAILLPDFAIVGPVNMQYGHHFTATATSNPEQVRTLWEQYSASAKVTAELPSDEDAVMDEVDTPAMQASMEYGVASKTPAYDLIETP